MALAEGTPASWQPGSYPVPYALLGKAKGKSEDRPPPLPVKVVHAGPITLPPRP